MAEAKIKPAPVPGPIEKWELVRKLRALDLDEAHKKGITHTRLLLQKCDCPHLSFDESLYKSATQEKIIAKWHYQECKKICDEAETTAIRTP